MTVNDLTQTIIGCAYKVHNTLGDFSRRFTRTLCESNLKEPVSASSNRSRSVSCMAMKS
jgi:hypothetical protein